jgi:hypothetical protein
LRRESDQVIDEAQHQGEIESRRRQASLLSLTNICLGLGFLSEGMTGSKPATSTLDDTDNHPSRANTCNSLLLGPSRLAPSVP